MLPSPSLSNEVRESVEKTLGLRWAMLANTGSLGWAMVMVDENVPLRLK